MGHSSIFYFKCTACGACGAAYGNWACLVRRLRGQGDSRIVCSDGGAGALLGSAEGGVGDLGALVALGGAG